MSNLKTWSWAEGGMVQKRPGELRGRFVEYNDVCGMTEQRIDRTKVFGHCQELWRFSREAEEAIMSLRKRLGDLQQATFTEHTQ